MIMRTTTAEGTCRVARKQNAAIIRKKQVPAHKGRLVDVLWCLHAWNKIGLCVLEPHLSTACIRIMQLTKFQNFDCGLHTSTSNSYYQLQQVARIS